MKQKRIIGLLIFIGSFLFSLGIITIVLFDIESGIPAAFGGGGLGVIFYAIILLIKNKRVR